MQKAFQAALKCWQVAFGDKFVVDGFAPMSTTETPIINKITERNIIDQKLVDTILNANWIANLISMSSFYWALIVKLLAQDNKERKREELKIFPENWLSNVDNLSIEKWGVIRGIYILHLFVISALILYCDKLESVWVGC